MDILQLLVIFVVICVFFYVLSYSKNKQCNNNTCGVGVYKKTNVVFHEPVIYEADDESDSDISSSGGYSSCDNEE